MAILRDPDNLPVGHEQEAPDVLRDMAFREIERVTYRGNLVGVNIYLVSSRSVQYKQLVREDDRKDDRMYHLTLRRKPDTQE